MPPRLWQARRQRSPKAHFLQPGCVRFPTGGQPRLVALGTAPLLGTHACAQLPGHPSLQSGEEGAHQPVSQHSKRLGLAPGHGLADIQATERQVNAQRAHLPCRGTSWFHLLFPLSRCLCVSLSLQSPASLSPSSFLSSLILSLLAFPLLSASIPVSSGERRARSRAACWGLTTASI